MSLILGALFSSISVTDSSHKFFLAVLGVISLIISTTVTVVIQLIKKEKDWYGGRAMAESVKTTCWRFIMRAEPYNDRSEIKVEKKFIEDLSVIKDEKRFLARAIASKLNIRPQITDKMKKIRTLSVNERLTLYLEKRIKNQREWYNSNSIKNKRLEEFFFILITCVQVITFLSAILLMILPDQKINTPSLFTTIIGILFAWMQLKRFQELSQSYGIAALELGMIIEEGKHVRTESGISNFVLNSENAISREHTLWIARKSEI